MSIQEESEKSEKELLDEIFNVIDELSNIECKYYSSCDTSRSEVVFKAREILLEGFLKEFNEEE